MKQFYCTCIFLFACFLSDGQNFDHADSLYEAGEYRLAAISYERLAFDHSSNIALLKKSYCYKALQEFGEATTVLKRIRLSTRDSLFSIVSYEKILNAYLDQNFQGSYNEILRYKLITGSSDNEIVFLEILNLIALNEWEKAKVILSENKISLSITEDEIDYVFDKKLKTKNPDKAYNLSIFLPGVGQMYAGYPLKGIVSGGIQTVFAGLSIYSFYQGYFFSGSLTGVALFYTFYFGGARYARKLALKRNKEVAFELSTRLQEITK